MEMSLIALLLGLSLALVLTAKILKMRDMSYKMFLRLGVLACVAAGTPCFFVAIVQIRNTPESLFSAANVILLVVVFDLIAAFRSKGKAIPPCVPVTRPGQGRVTRTTKDVVRYLLIGFVFYFALRVSLTTLGQMSRWDMVACGFFTMAAIIRGFQSLFLKVEICRNGLWDRPGSRPMFKPWEAFESFSWTEETKDSVELRLQAKSAGHGATPLLVRPGARAVVQQILEANLPDELSAAHTGLSHRIPPQCVRVRRTRLRRLAWQVASVLCWPTAVLLLVFLWERNVSLEEFSGVGFVLIMITMGVNFWPSKIIEICRKGLLVGDELRAWEQYECFLWKGETQEGVELRLPLKEGLTTRSITRLVIAPEDRGMVQNIFEANLPDRSKAPGAYAGWSLPL